MHIVLHRLPGAKPQWTIRAQNITNRRKEGKTLRQLPMTATKSITKGTNNLTAVNHPQMSHILLPHLPQHPSRRRKSSENIIYLTHHHHHFITGSTQVHKILYYHPLGYELLFLLSPTETVYKRCSVVVHNHVVHFNLMGLCGSECERFHVRWYASLYLRHTVVVVEVVYVHAPYRVLPPVVCTQE